jgi:ATP-dependent DNA ligase
VKADAVIDGELVAIGKDGASHFQLLQNALRHEAKLLYCAFDLMFARGPACAAAPRAQQAAQGHPATPQADRIQQPPQR